MEELIHHISSTMQQQQQEQQRCSQPRKRLGTWLGSRDQVPALSQDSQPNAQDVGGLQAALQHGDAP
jgi:hypothetical protein